MPAAYPFLFLSLTPNLGLMMKAPDFFRLPGSPAGLFWYEQGLVVAQSLAPAAGLLLPRWESSTVIKWKYLLAGTVRELLL